MDLTIKILLRVRPLFGILVFILFIIYFNKFLNLDGEYRYLLDNLSEKFSIEDEFIGISFLVLLIIFFTLLRYIIKYVFAYLILFIDKNSLHETSQKVINHVHDDINVIMDKIYEIEQKDVGIPINPATNINLNFYEAFDYFADQQIHSFFFYYSRNIYLKYSDLKYSNPRPIFNDEGFMDILEDLRDKKVFHLIKLGLAECFNQPKHIRKVWLKAKHDDKSFQKKKTIPSLSLTEYPPTGHERDIFKDFLEHCFEEYKKIRQKGHNIV